jgi:hypothetical protein
MSGMLCDTNTTAEVRMSSRTRLRHLIVKLMSPTASTSSKKRMSGSIRMAATAKPKPHGHAGAEVLHGHIYELLDLGKGDDLVDAGVHQLFAEAKHRCVDVDVLPRGEDGVETRAQSDERTHLPMDLDAAAIRLDEAIEGTLSKVVLPAPLCPIRPKHSPRRTSKSRSLHGPEFLRAQVQGARPAKHFIAHIGQSIAQGGLQVPTELLGDPLHFDEHILFH